MNSLTGLASIKALLQIEDFPSPSSSILQCKTGLGHAVVSRRKRSWSRAVFSNLQRKGLERTFQDQKYITKPERKRLAANLGLHDAQVKVWFQNRRMKWRHMIKSTQLPLIPGSVSIIKGSSEGVTATEHYSNTNKICTLNINENIEDIDVTID
ncbi:homeobox protein H2.0-like [Anopheles cruzii]|uniref:homeobox protein H2.0-like n=1 Tax=Anopheles cruzii TaxID=68878 RepID=UPI0022EC7446|nr:homeobox protein H2.0-like [Anopheles cruzii]